jgi:hypothetical protein
MLSGCAQDAALAVTAALTVWWKEALPCPPPPIKAGAVTPAHTIALKTGRVLAIPGGYASFLSKRRRAVELEKLIRVRGGEALRHFLIPLRGSK